MDKAEKVGIIFPQILIPDKKTNKKKWAVIACDQFTSNESYWNKTARIVGGAPSTLHLIVPEAFLNDDDIDDRIAHIKVTMSDFIEDGILVRLPPGVMLIERETPSGTRIGVVLAVDLEKYEIDYKKRPLIRATEQTVVERIPPRMKIRDGALLECPHVMLMLNDPEDKVISAVYQARANHTKVYDTPLMQDGGNVKGWFIDDPDVLADFVDSLEKLKSKSDQGMLFAVGDGNHSLASAKAVWDEHKQEMTKEERETSPLRYALAEVVNLYDNGISLHPIHRVLFNVEASKALRTLISILNDMGIKTKMMYTRGAKLPPKKDTQTIIFESKMAKGRIEIKEPTHGLLAYTLTVALDRLLEELPRAKIDYIHGDEEFRELSNEHGCLGFMMDPMTKDQLFESVAKYGVLPRKAFSLGEAREKRYYYECRLLVDTKDNEQQEDSEETTMQSEPEIQAEQPAADDVMETGEQSEKRSGRKKRGLFFRKRDKE